MSHKHCPSCGTAQDPNTRYFPPDDEKIAAEDHQYVGRDKVCPYCDAPNSALAKFCTECAAPIEGNREVSLVEEKQQTAALTELNNPSNNGKWIVGVILLALVFLIGLFQFTEERSVIVQSHSWSRTIDIEQYKTVTEDDWRDRVPMDGRIKSCRDKERETKQIPDGEECQNIKTDNGDGTYNESEKCTTIYKSIPIYDDWCKYEINKWVVVDTKIESGSSLMPLWPTLSIKMCSIKALKCEREGNRIESYTVHLIDEKEKPHTCDFQESKWKSISVNTEKMMLFGQLTGNIDCDSWDE